MKMWSNVELSCWMVVSFLIGCFSIIYLVASVEGTAINNQRKINEIIEKCEATLPRNQSCKILFSTEVVTDVVDNLENRE